MLRLCCGVVGKCCFLLLLVSLAANSAFAQLETATVSGQVVDPSGLSITGAQVKLVDIDRDTTTGTATNPSGLYTFPSVRPGRYRMEVTAAGFKVVNVTGMTVNVQDHLEQNFKLAVGSVSESVTVEGGSPLVNTESASVSTVVDRQFAENLPMNGRSFQTLIQLTPGVVLTASSSFDGGQFSVSGQRADANYWTVDGVSANIGVSSYFPAGNGLGGSLGSFSAQGGTNSLVSVDALQEFRIQTSTYAPEFGRTPGGQISIVTRSGTNQFHGTAFDYLRNDALDANNWFNGYTNTPALPKAEERQNDFGGTFSGPIFKNKTFFFFSYEGLRLRLPQTSLTTVPDVAARQSAAPTTQPYLNAFPLPNGTELGNGIAQFDSSFSNPSTLDAYSLRIDHKVSDKLSLFGRYNYSPSQIDQRGAGALNTVNVSRITTQTATVGATWTPSHAIVDDLRFNYSRTNASSYFFMDDFGGAEPLASLPFPSPFTNQNGVFSITISSLVQGVIQTGQNLNNALRQINIIDSLSLQKGSHGLKFGVDFRRVTPAYDPVAYNQSASFNAVADAESGVATGFSSIVFNRGVTFLFRNLGLYAQDTWRVGHRVTMTYGLRWDIDFVPESLVGPALPAVTGFNLTNLPGLALAPAGTPPYKTTYSNFAPRLGLAYQISDSQSFATVLRGGFGMFYDLATSQVGNNITNEYPFGAVEPLSPPVPFPFDSVTAAPPAITPLTGITAFDPNLQLPYTLEWNVALEQALGGHQTLSGSYIGSTGRRLIGTALVIEPNPSLGAAYLVTNASTSDYDAFQIQYKRRLAARLQALASYTWSHSIDDGSAGSLSSGNPSNGFLPSTGANPNRGPSSFDIRNAFSLAVTYDIPTPKMNAFGRAILGGWSTENFFLARSAPPVDLTDGDFFNVFSGFTYGNVRPDLVPGEPLYLYGSAYPGGKAFNRAAFTDPPSDPNTGLPLRQGDASRNLMRGFGAAQWDFAVHRDFPLRESLHLQLRAEMFNLLNHPTFAPPGGCFGITCTAPFGVPTQTLGQYLGGNVGGGGFSPLYQIGGPRSIQLALKLNF